MANTTHHKRLKFITFTLGATPFQCQVRSWQIINNTDDGEKFFVFCGPPDTDGEFREEADDDYMLELSFFSDWRSGGISDFLTTQDQETIAFVLDHHPDVPAEHVQWSGQVKVKAPTVGGDARATEMTDVSFPIIGKPTYLRV